MARKTTHSGRSYLDEIFDINTGEKDSYVQVTTWWDGTAMNDGKCDGVIFKKYTDGSYYKRVIKNHTVNLLWWGAVADNATDTAPMLTAAIAALPSTGDYTIFIPAGDYRFNSTITLNKPIRILGTVGTYLFFAISVQALHVVGNMYRGYRPSLKDIAVYAAGKSTTDGWTGGVYPIGDIDPDPSHFQYHGILIETLCDLENVKVGSFSGHGVRVYGSISDGSNASHVIIRGGLIESNRGAGIYISGPDANACLFDGIDIRDNNLCGVYDESFLGNEVRSCMLHDNGYYFFGHYKQTNANAVPVVVGNYFEGQPVPNSMISPYGYAVDQTNGAGWTGNGAYFSSGKWNKMFTGAGVAGSNVQIGFSNDPVNESVSFDVYDHSGGSSARLKSTNANTIEYNQVVNNAYNDIWTFGSIRAIIGGGSTNGQYRGLYFPSHGFMSVLIGGKFFQHAKSVANADLVPFSYMVGDVVYNSNYNGANPEGWICTQAGFGGATIPPYTGTIQISTEGDTTLHTNGQTRDLLPGDTIVVDGQEVTILSKNLTNGVIWYFRCNKNMPANATWRNVSGYGTSLKWKAFGQGRGTTAQRPTLTADDAGWKYFDTTINSLIEWTGTAWRILEDTAVNLTDAATINTDASLGKEFRVTLGGNRTMAAPTNPRDAQTIRYRIKQDATGNRTITWDTAAFRFSTDAPAPVLSTDPDYFDYVQFVYNATDSVWDCLGSNCGFAPMPAL